MHWYGDLYVGAQAMKEKSRIIRKIKSHKFIKDVFVITEAFNGYDLFDIYPANVLMQRYFKNKEYQVIGIAKGYDEAIGLVQVIIEDLYCKRGIKNLRTYFEENGAGGI
ncbi:MAG: hypothetical protein IJW18_03360 [Lachnospiraceae bacterium]|nr:hypothetical protein [Lachnospiraceae bacterium]